MQPTVKQPAEPLPAAHLTEATPLRVCYFGTYRQEYTRNRIMLTGLRYNQVSIVECHVQLWQSIEDRVAVVAGGWQSLKFWYRLARSYTQLLRRYWSIRHEYDVLVVGYPGQLDVLLARLLTWWQRKPLVWDIFMSIYLIASERGLQRKNALGVRLLRSLEWFACRLPDHLLLDTAEYVNWFHTVHGIAQERFSLVPTGADSDLFYPQPAQAKQTGLFKVLYYGTFIPNHGVCYIIEAARCLSQTANIRFELIGQGPERAVAMQLAQAYHLPNVTFVDWLDQTALIERIADADLCLGAFGTTPQSLMTIQNKIYEGLAMGKPVLTGDGPAIRQQLRHGEEIFLCERANPQALAAAIQTLAADPDLRAQLAQCGAARFQADFTLRQLGARFKAHLLKIHAAARKQA